MPNIRNVFFNKRETIIDYERDLLKIIKKGVKKRNADYAKNLSSSFSSGNFKYIPSDSSGI